MIQKRQILRQKVLSNAEIRPDIFLLKLAAPEISSRAAPGQFCMLRVTEDESNDPFLKRPLSIHRVSKDTGEIDFLYRIIGRGTELLALKREGEEIEIIGPLGHGFKIEDEEIPIIVGGGLGVAPLLFLADTLKGTRGVVILGAVTKSLLLRLGAFKESGLEILVATEDGSFGNKGLVTEVFDRLMARLDESDRKRCMVFSCGPFPMLRALYHLCKIYRVKCQVSLETYMACGTGLCLGCAVKGGEGFLHVCKEGPCVDAKLIDWEG